MSCLSLKGTHDLLVSQTVLVELCSSWLLAASPTSISSSLKATMEGLVLESANYHIYTHERSVIAIAHVDLYVRLN